MQAIAYKQVTDIALDVNGDWLVSGTATPLAYLIPEDSHAVVHVNATDLNRGTAKVGPSWATTGSIPITAGSIKSVGPFTGNSDYSLPYPNPLAFAARQSFSVTAIVQVNVDDGSVLIASSDTTDFNYFWCFFSIAGSPPKITFGVGTVALGEVDCDDTIKVGETMVISFGYDGATNNLFLKVNARAIVTQNLGGPSAQSTTPTTLGNYYIGSSATWVPLSGAIFELLASTNTPSDSYFTSLYNSITAGLTGGPGADLQLIGDGPGLQQAVNIALKFFLGEWFLDQSVGVPWFQDIFIKNPNPAAIQAIIRSTILAVPGITSVSNVTISSPGQARSIKISWAATGNLGQLVQGTVQQQF